MYEGRAQNSTTVVKIELMIVVMVVVILLPRVTMVTTIQSAATK